MTSIKLPNSLISKLVCVYVLCSHLVCAQDVIERIVRPGMSFR